MLTEVVILDRCERGARGKMTVMISLPEWGACCWLHLLLDKGVGENVDNRQNERMCKMTVAM